jgi:hypothetical protein
MKLLSAHSRLGITGALFLLLLAGCHGQSRTIIDEVNRWDTIISYGLVITWAIVQWLLHRKFKAINRRTVFMIASVALYMQWWIYVAFATLITGLTLAIFKGYLLNNILTAVTAKTIAFLILDHVPRPPNGVVKCLDKIHNATRVKWGHCKPVKGPNQKIKDERKETCILNCENEGNGPKQQFDEEKGVRQESCDEEKFTCNFKYENKGEGRSQESSDKVKFTCNLKYEKKGDGRKEQEKVWIKYVVILVKEPRYKDLHKKIEEMQFKTGKWEGIYEDKTTEPMKLRVNTQGDNTTHNWEQHALNILYEFTRGDREKVHASGCLFTADDDRIAKGLTNKNWITTFQDDCDGDWFFLLARQLQAMVHTKVLNVPLSKEKFKSSNVYGYLKASGRVNIDEYTPSLRDVDLFRAAVYESFRGSNQTMDVEKVIRILYDSKTHEKAAEDLFDWMCGL